MNYDIIVSPVITEKTQILANENVYVFKVSKKANKTQIKQTIESKFGVKVKSVNTLNTSSKKKRVGRYTGKTQSFKKAMIKLCDGSKIEF